MFNTLYNYRFSHKNPQHILIFHIKNLPNKFHQAKFKSYPLSSYKKHSNNNKISQIPIIFIKATHL